MGWRGERGEVKGENENEVRYGRDQRRALANCGPFRPHALGNYLATCKILSRPLVRNKFHPTEPLTLRSTSYKTWEPDRCRFGRRSAIDLAQHHRQHPERGELSVKVAFGMKL